MPVRSKVRKPCRDTCSLYGPVGRFGNRYAPVSSVTAVRVTLVSTCVTVTVTPGSTAPLSSRTAPLICAVACAQAADAARRMIKVPREQQVSHIFIM
jgi:hypothetical protein